MARGSFARVQNQATVFFKIKLKKKLDPRTPQGKSRLASLLLGLLVLCVVVPKISGSTDASSSDLSLRSLNGATTTFDDSSTSSDGSFSFLEDDDDDGEDEDEDGGANIDGSNSKTINTKNDGNDEDDEEDDGHAGGLRGGGSGGSELLSVQRRLLKEEGAELLKFFEEFRSEAAIHAYLNTLMTTYPHLGNFVKKKIIGQTGEKQPIVAYSLGRGQVQRDVLVVGLEHASEWSVPMSLVYFITRMVQLYEIKPQVTEVLKAVTFHIIPVANPDGYAYSQSKAHEARHWFKNRGGDEINSPSSHSKHHSKPADIALSWASGTSSGKHSSSSSNSSPESAAIAKFAQSLSRGNKKMSGFVSVHCCGGQVVAPGKLKCDAQGSDDKHRKSSLSDAARGKEAKAAQKALGERIAKAMAQPAPGRTVHAYTFKVEHARDNTGSSWANHELGLIAGFTLQLRPPGSGVSSKSSKGKHSSAASGSNVRMSARDKKAGMMPESEIVEASRDVAFGLLEIGKFVAEDFTPIKHMCPVSTLASASKAGGDNEDEKDDGENENMPKATDIKDADNDADDEGDDANGGDVDTEEEGGGEEEEEEEEEDMSSLNTGDDDDEDDENNDTHNGSINDDDDDDNDDEDEDESAFQNSSPNDRNHNYGDTGDDVNNRIIVSKRASRTTVTESELDFAKQFVKAGGVSMPLLDKADLPPSDGSGPHVLYFAYGVDMLYDILLNAGIKSAIKVVNARLHGFAYDYTYFSSKVWKSGVADIVKQKGRYVVGVLYRLDKSELARLDSHNLVNGGHVERIRVNVVDKSGHVYKAVTFRVSTKVTGVDVLDKYKRFHPSRQYRNCILRGAKRQHLSAEYITTRLSAVSAMFTDKIGSTKFRNERIGKLCDHQYTTVG